MSLHSSSWRSALRALAIGLVLAGIATWAMPRGAPAQAAPVKMEWLGWSFFRFTSPTGKVILTNPFITRNADAAVKLEDITRADLIFLMHPTLEPKDATMAVKLVMTDNPNLKTLS